MAMAFQFVDRVHKEQLSLARSGTPSAPIWSRNLPRVEVSIRPSSTGIPLQVRYPNIEGSTDTTQTKCWEHPKQYLGREACC